MIIIKNNNNNNNLDYNIKIWRKPVLNNNTQ